MDGVSRTALAVAAVRAHEDARPDRLFTDPYAQAFLDAVPGAFDAEQGEFEQGAADAFAENVVVRTRFFDDYLLEAAGAGVHQVVLLAAGLDTRALRLRWPDHVTVYELDLPEVFAFKDSVLPADPGKRRCVGLDLTGDWTIDLRDAGFRESAPTAWLIEGLLLYLTADEAAQLLDRVTSMSAPRSRLATDVDDPALRRAARDMPAIRRYSALWRGGLPDTEDELRQRGWLTQVNGGAATSRQYGRAGRATSSFVVAMRPVAAGRGSGAA
jgi:methyltransferase (TIGR00027 family)